MVWMSGDVNYKSNSSSLFTKHRSYFGIILMLTLKKLLKRRAMELLQIATAWFITKCDGQVLQIAMIITNRESTVPWAFVSVTSGGSYTK